MDDSTINFTYGEKFNPRENKIDDPKGESGTCSYQHFMWYILQHGLKPYETDKEIETAKTAHMHEKSDYWRRVFQGLSWGQITQGTKQYLDHIKHRLEYGSNHNATRFAYGLGKTLNWLPVLGGDDALLELKSRLQDSEQKMIDETRKRLENMGGDDRRRLIEEILVSKASLKTEVYGAMLAKLSDGGGTLYSGSHLSKYVGSRAFFRKLGGTDAIWEKTKRRLLSEENERESEEHVTEEEILHFWFKTAEVEDRGVFPAGFHSKFKSAWNDGREKEKKKGIDETGEFHHLDHMVEYGVKKMADGEYPIAWGCMERTWGK